MLHAPHTPYKRVKWAPAARRNGIRDNGHIFPTCSPSCFWVHSLYR